LIIILVLAIKVVMNFFVKPDLANERNRMRKIVDEKIGRLYHDKKDFSTYW